MFDVVQVQILNNSVCDALFGIMTDNMMCTAGDNGRGTCYGDSGGPAVVQQPDGSFVQVGLFFWGGLAGVCGIFTNVSDPHRSS